jgi:iron complex transport system substrate-binding protein
MVARRVVIAAVAVLAFGGTLAAKLALRRRVERPAAPPADRRRIVSLAPSITETIYALGRGDRLVGVTRYCDYPPEALELPRVGGYLDPNYEAIIDKHPDLVITLGASEHGRVRRALADMGVELMTVRQDSVEGILDSLTPLGRACGAPAAAERMAADLRARMAVVAEATRGRPRRRVLISFGRSMGSGGIKEVYVAGKDGFYDRLIELAGGVNAYARKVPRYPEVSVEGLLDMAPDVIIDLVPEMDRRGLSRETVMAEWAALSELEAVKRGRVHILTGDYVDVPGPRFILLLEDIARLVHPEVAWPEKRK